MKNWIKSIIREVIREEIQKTPLIIACREPTSLDFYQTGTVWLSGTERYVATKIEVTWVKQ